MRLTGDYKGNKKRHLLTLHPAYAKEIGCIANKRKRNDDDNAEGESMGNSKKKAMKLSKGSYIRYCLELIIFQFVSISLLNSSALRILTKIHAEAAKIVVNAANAVIFLETTAKLIREKITDEVKGKMISLKIDAATRYGRSMMGVNIQYYSSLKKKIVVRTLGMVELLKGHTTQYLEEQVFSGLKFITNGIFKMKYLQVKKLMKKFSIDERNIYSYTTDNGANFVCLGNLMKKLQASKILSDEITELRESLQSESESSNDSDDDDEEEQDFDDEFEEYKIANEEEHFQVLSVFSVIRCAAHTLQLAIFDALKELRVEFTINEIRKIVHKLRSSKFNAAFSQLKMKKPKLDVCTRWNSLYLMFQSLLDNKVNYQKFYKLLGSVETKDASLTEAHWEFMNKFCESFKVPYKCTQNLQAQQLSMSTLISTLFNLQ